ncbi:MAG: ABC transporter ATP-binding protein [Actinobacteria bacterium]|nr:ABC transporter ATP-binding protein [Actinomycetota bacterium]
MGDGTAPVIQLKSITKRFGTLVANDRVDLEVLPGEIHALVGENGAGKSTLMKILCGLYQPESGQILIRGQVRAIDSPRKAIDLGIGMVHQHFMLIQRFNVTENIMLGAEVARAGVLDYRQAAGRVEELCRRYDFALDPQASVADLSVGQQQRVEILKVLYRGAEILVMDEPTAVLAPQEVEELFRNLRSLREQGKTIIFIAHKLEEVLRIADRITVLRRGILVGTVEARGTTRSQLAEMMVGRPVLLAHEKPQVRTGTALLRVSEVSIPGRGGRPAVKRVSLEVRAGEIYGIAGIEGNGQTELVEAIVGLRPVASGHLMVTGKDVTGWGVREIRNLGVAYIPEDRHRRGLILPMMVWENVILGQHRDRRFLSRGILRTQSIVEQARRLVQEFDIRLSSVVEVVSGLSGGNQQKVILAREFANLPQIIVASQPTRGLDIGATEFVEERLIRAKAAGKAVLVISADLDQVLSLSDRVGVMYGGEIVAEFRPDEVTPEEVGEYMLGSRRKETT